MADPTLDPLHQQIYSAISPHRGRLSGNFVRAITGNIAFLVKYMAGSRLQAQQVSITVTDV
ncbi:hypothetical protein EJ02DRAFT_423010 [Clathrospora elynae]|uniref:Uncharacterized protein n=1 Tax=Clathrospora elynae TaxID=706981 RepID=A0A6A5SP03_9PLEO|nr:hypothetical protein EJ02DRAFT_423010 [Clathrospora elynae]